MYKLTIFLTILLSINSAWASDSSLKEHTFNYESESFNTGINPIDKILVSPTGSVGLNGIDVSISGWSDSELLHSDDSGNYDRVVKANVQKVGDYGWAVKNSWESSGYHQTIDNVSGDHYLDYDFLLFSFSEAVTLDNINFGWARLDGQNQEVSVAGLGEAGFNALTSESSTWSSIISGAISNSFSITSNSNGLSSSLNFTESANYWLVGAYNTVFGEVNNGSLFNDGFKISGIELSRATSQDEPFDEPTQVSEPGALALMSLGLGLVLYRRKRRA